MKLKNQRSYVVLMVLSAVLLLGACTSIRPNIATAPTPFAPPIALDVGAPGSFKKDKTYAITILHTNDHHGRFWQNRNGEYGLAARKTLIDSIRAEVKAAGGYTLLLDGGDINTGVPESDIQNAEPDFKGMAMLKYDAMAVGNHEFDKSNDILAQQVSWAGFPIISANIYKDGKRMFNPYAMFNLGGVKVAVFGMTTSDTYKLVLPDNVKDIEFRDPAVEAAKLVPELHQKADVVIAATHMGHYTNGEHGTNVAGDVALARSVKGIDLIVGGHSQNPVCMLAENKRNDAYMPGTPCAPDQQNGAWIVQAHEWGKYVGRADFTFKNGVLTLKQYALLPVNLMKKVKDANGKDTLVPYTKAIAEDNDMLAFLKPYQNKGNTLLSQKIGVLEGDLDGDRAHVRSQPTNLGVFVAYAMMQRVKADFAIMNSGGVRDSIKAGEVTYRDILKVQPFGNTIVSVDLSGKEALDLLAAAAKMSKGAGAFPQFAGVELVITGDQLNSAKIKGTVIAPKKTYRVALNNFVAAGGDGYPKLNKHPGFIDSGYVDAEVLKDMFTSLGKVNATQYDPGNAVVRQ